MAVPSWLPDGVDDDIRADAAGALGVRRRSSSGRDHEVRPDRPGDGRAWRLRLDHDDRRLAPAALNIARKRQPIAPAPKMIADSPGRGFALLTPLTTQASGSMSAAIADDGASESGNVNRRAP